MTPTRRAALALPLLAAPALAQGQPPLRLLVGFPPGGGIDLLSRVMGEALAARTDPLSWAYAI